MSKNIKQNRVLYLLALLFLAPGLAAYLFFTHPQWLGSKATNKGQLLNPAQKIEIFGDSKKWRLVLWQPNSCKSSCLKQLDKLARIRLALGRHLYQVDQFLLLPDTIVQLPAQTLHKFKELDIHAISLRTPEYSSQSVLTKGTRIFIVSPEDYFILSYPLDAKSADIFHDLKHLLTAGKQSG